MNRLISRYVSLVCVIVSVLAFAGRAEAAWHLHLSQGTAQFISPTDFVGSGVATHLGAYSETGSAAFTPTSNPAVLNVDGEAHYTAADGDVLHADVTGKLNGQTGALRAAVWYVGGTGRFEGALGFGWLTGQVQPDGALSVRVVGFINF